MIGVVAAVLVVSCDAPSSPAGSTKVVPYLAGHYSENFNGSKGEFSLYLAEGKSDGPSIKDAEVFFDGVVVPMSGYGYYALHTAPKLVEGEIHKVVVRHANFSTVEATLQVPSGTPDGIVVQNPPDDWYQPLDTTKEKSFTIVPATGAGTWADVMVRAPLYNRFSLVARTYLYQPTGSAPQVCTFPAGHGVYVGFGVRKLFRIIPAGTTPDSQLTAEGLVVVQAGFDPREVSKAIARIDLRYDGEYTSASATFTDDAYRTFDASSVVIGGAALTQYSGSYAYFGQSWAGSKWNEGDLVSYSFVDPVGKTVSGTFTWHTEDFPLPPSTPGKEDIKVATEVSFAAPDGGWPENARISLIVKRDATHWLTQSAFGSGTTPVVFKNDNPDYDWATALSVEFRGTLETQYTIPGYRGQINISGPGTPW